MKPDVIINVRFFVPSEGGRTAALEGQFYACPLFVDNEGFDCRLMLGGRRLELGASYEVPVKFLYRELALPKVFVGKEVFLWEGRNVAKGHVVEVVDKS